MNEAGKRLKELAIYLGEATNNVAETCALILSLQEISRLGAKRVTVLTDSELLARQVTGVYRVRDTQLQWLHVLIQNLIAGFDHFEIQHVPREKNRAADRLANRAVDDIIKQGRRPDGRLPAVRGGRKVRTPQGSGMGNTHPS